MSTLEVVLDCVVFDLQPNGGISRYWVNLIAGLAALPSAPRLHLLINAIPSSESARQVVDLARTNPRLTLHPYHSRALDRIRPPPVPRHLVGRAVFHSSYYRAAARMRNVVTIHDFTYEDIVGGWHALAQHWQKSQAVSRSSAVVCVSESTRRDFKRRFPGYRAGPIDVIHHGVEAHFSPHKEVSIRPAPGGDYVLFVGRRDAYKNFGCVVEALKHARQLRLTLVGPPLTGEERRRLDAELPGRHTAHVQVDDAGLIDLYRNAFALAYPSAYEGFGLPLLEAMACGCPVIALRASSIPEVAGDGAILLEEATADAIRNALGRLRDGALRRVLVKRGLAQAERFSWSAAAARYAALYGAAL